MPLALSASGPEALDESAASPALGMTAWGTPVLVSPNSGTYLYNFPRQVTLAWNLVSTATYYQVERAYWNGSTYVTTTTWVNANYSGALTNASYSFVGVGDNTFRWRVRAYKPSVYTPWSSYWYFYFRTKPTMATPVLINPYIDEVFDHFPRTTTLSWKALPGAWGYKVEIAYCNDAKTVCTPYPPVIRVGYLNSYYQFAFVGAQPGRWRVTALGDDPAKTTPHTYYDSPASAWRWFSYTN